jgi:hypothetical protein
LSSNTNILFPDVRSPLLIVGILNNPVCLQVQANDGEGLVLQDAPHTFGEPIETFANGSMIYVDSLAFALQSDEVGQYWLYFNRPQAGWVLATAYLGAPINLSLCNASEAPQ